MPNFIELGQCPYNENAAQLGEPNYRANAIRECQAYIQAIRNYLGEEPEGAALAHRGFAHDFGTHYEVICTYDPGRPEAVAYALRCEREAPATWEEGGVKPPSRIAESPQRRGR
jgi:hypothetical protein